MGFRTAGEAMGRRAAACALALALCACVDKSDLPRPVVQADATAGLAVIKEVGCAACHRIPGVAWPEGRTGGSLAGVGARPMIAGRLPNQPAVMAAFVRDAPSLLPDTGMPPMPLTQAEARGIAAYLYTLDDD